MRRKRKYNFLKVSNWLASRSDSSSISNSETVENDDSACNRETVDCDENAIIQVDSVSDEVSFSFPANSDEQAPISDEVLPEIVECRTHIMLVETDALIKSFEQMHTCLDGPDIKLFEIPSLRQGHMKSFKVRCNSCKKETYINNGNTAKPTFRESKDANRRFTFAADCAGLDKADVEMLCEILDIGKPPDSYYSLHQNEICNYLVEKLEEKFNKNRAESKDLHPKDIVGIALIPVKVDGTYQRRGDRKRGYTSKIAVVILLDATTNRFLDLVILNKYCHTCTQQEKIMTEDDFEEWLQSHTCDANFEGPSSEMERQAVRDMFIRSKALGMRYQYLVGDGDSKAFHDVWDIYGVCDECEKYSDILSKRDPVAFESWVLTDEYTKWAEAHEDINHCKAVRKLDCTQHVGKGFRDKLENLAKKPGEKAPDGKSLNRGNHRLNIGTRITLQKYFSKAIRDNIHPGVIDSQQLRKAAGKMRQAILASLYHCTMLEDEEIRHQYCPENSWCSYKRGRPVEVSKHYMDACFLEILLPIYEFYTHEALLQKLVPGMNTNALECFNSVLWSLIPKTKYHGRKRTQISVALAVFFFEDGRESITNMLDDLNIPSASAKEYTLKCDKRRAKLKQSREQKKNQIYLSRLKEALGSVPADEKPSYGPGICDAADGPSSHMATTPFLPQVDSMPIVNQFVAIACGPQWYAEKVYDADAVQRLIQIEFMYTEDHLNFYFKSDSDISYEGLVWEPVSNIISFLPEPTMVQPSLDRGRSRKTKSAFSIDTVFVQFTEDSVENAWLRFREFRKQHRSRK